MLIGKMLENWYQNTPKMEAQRQPQTTLDPDNFPTESRHRPGDPQGVPKWSQKGAKRVPKGSPKGAKREPKSNQNRSKVEPEAQSPRNAAKGLRETWKDAENLPRGPKKMIKMYKNGTKITPKWEYEGHKREGDAESDLERRRKTRRDAQ